MVFLVTCIYNFLKHLIRLLKCKFQGSILHLITDTDSLQGHAIQNFFFKVETLFNNAFKE